MGFFQFQPLLDNIAIKHKMKAIFCIATHSREDRTAGLEYFKNKSKRLAYILTKIWTINR